MHRKSKSSFKMKGHTLPGIKQKSSAFQMKEDEDSPNKFLGLGSGGLLGKNLMSAGKDLLGKIGGKGGGEEEDAEAGKELLKEEAKESMEQDSAMAMKSPNKKKLKTGTKSTVGGKLNEGASPHQKI
jgi:hypothetical protein